MSYIIIIIIIIILLLLLLIIIIIIPSFYMRFSRKAQRAYNILSLSRSLDTVQCHTYSAQFPLPGENSLPGIVAYDNGAGKFKHNNLSHLTGSPFIHLG